MIIKEVHLLWLNIFKGSAKGVELKSFISSRSREHLIAGNDVIAIAPRTPYITCHRNSRKALAGVQERKVFKISLVDMFSARDVTLQPGLHSA